MDRTCERVIGCEFEVRTWVISGCFRPLLNCGVNTIPPADGIPLPHSIDLGIASHPQKHAEGSTSRMAGSAVLPTGEFALHVGQSLQDSVVGPSYHSLRYDFKPASVNTEAPGSLTIGIDGQVNLV